MKPQRSLKARALQYLAQREQSRLELRRKLLPQAQAEIAAAEATCHADSGASVAAGASATERVDAVLDWLVAHDYLSSERFVESRVHARAPRFGNLRIRQELKQHAEVLPAGAAQALKESELERARAVRSRKFRELPSGAAELARQMRFLMGRGFSPDVIHRALRDADAGAVDTHEPGPSVD